MSELPLPSDPMEQKRPRIWTRARKWIAGGIVTLSTTFIGIGCSVLGEPILAICWFAAATFVTCLGVVVWEDVRLLVPWERGVITFGVIVISCAGFYEGCLYVVEKTERGFREPLVEDAKQSREYAESHRVSKAQHQSPKKQLRPEGGRELAEWQKVQMIAKLSQYSGTKIRILATQGDEVTFYANDFAEVFERSHWNVSGPRKAPSDQPVVDIELSISLEFWNKTRPESYSALRSELTTLKQKCYMPDCNFALDPDVAKDQLVMWIGPATPNATYGSGLNTPLKVPR
jgi:hypothetical protein